MKKTMKRRVSLILAILMAMTLTFPTYAEGRALWKPPVLRADVPTAAARFVSTDTLEDGKEYLIVRYVTAARDGVEALKQGTGGLEVGSVDIQSENSVFYVDHENNDAGLIWTAYANGEGFQLKNGENYFRIKSSSGVVSLVADTSTKNSIWHLTGRVLKMTLNSSVEYCLSYSNSNGFYAQKNGDSKILLFVKTSQPSVQETASSVAVSPKTLSLQAGGSSALTATVLPESISDRSVTWNTSNPGVATVSAEGLVTAVSAGTATITAESNLTAGVQDTCTVTVTAVPGEETVYYLNIVPQGISSDGDVYAEAEPGADVTADIYLSASREGSRLQAADLRFSADAGLTWKSASSAIPWPETDVTSGRIAFLGKTGEACPAIPKQTSDPASGLKIASVTYTMTEDAAYNVPFNLYFASGTEISSDAGALSAAISSMTENGQAGFETLKTLTVTFRENIPEGTSALQSVQYNTATALQTNAFTRAGYAFAGWNTASDGSGTAYTDGQCVTCKADLELFAQWTANTYVVHFLGNGSDSGTMEDQTFRYDEEQTLRKNTFARTGYTFHGWATDPNAAAADYTDEQSVKNLAESGEVTLYAVWSLDSYIVQFDMQGHGEQIAAQQIERNQSALRPEDPTDEAYDFGGWYIESACENEYDFAQPVTGDLTLFAKWTKKTYTVTFDPDNGEAVTQETVAHGDPLAQPEDPAKPGYTFLGWYNGESAYDFSAPVTGTLALKAKWQATPYTVEFDSDGGTAVSSMSYTIESTGTLPATEKSNYTFLGWKVTSAGGNWTQDENISAGTSLTGRYGDVTLTAQWSFALTIRVEDYRYARTGDVMICIADTLNDSGKVFTFNGRPMYYTTCADYIDGLSASGVYVYLIDGSYVNNGQLTAEGQARIGVTAASRDSVTYTANGDVNGDGKVTISDANAVYQMLNSSEKGNVYTYEQLSILCRLMADVSTAKAGATLRGSIADVEAIMELIRADYAGN